MSATIPDRMQAVVMHGPGDYRLEDVDVPTPGPDDLLLQVEAVGQVVRDLTDGYGADVYLEGSGATPAVGQGLTLLRKLGTYVEYSVFGSEVTVDWSIISDDKGLTVQGAHLGPHCWPAAIKLIETGAVPMEQICTHQFALADFGKGFDLVEDSSGDSVKVTLLP